MRVKHGPRTLDDSEEGNMVSMVADLRARCARLQIARYHLGAAINVHPARLGSYLTGTLPMPPAVAVRIDAALRELEREKAS